MVTVVDYAVKFNKEGEEFVSLVIQGDVELIQSKETGNFYASAYKTSISTTFNETLASKLVGTQLPGKIIKLDCDPYEYTIPESGEIIVLTHTYQYVKEEALAESFSENGQMAMA